MSKLSWYNIRAQGDELVVEIQGVIGGGYFGDGYTTKQLVEQLASSKTAKHIQLHVHSPGGSAFDGLAIYNRLKQHPAKVTAYVDGLAASAASVVLMAGDTVVMPSNALAMIHNPYGGCVGDASDMKKMAESLDKIGNSMIEVYQQKTGLDRAKLSKMLNAGTWLNGDEAKALGFADTVTRPVKIAASAGFDFSAYKHAPACLGGACNPTPISNHQRTETMTVDEYEKSILGKGLDGSGVEQRIDTEWQANQALRKVFTDIEACKAYFRAANNRQSRILGR